MLPHESCHGPTDLLGYRYDVAVSETGVTHRNADDCLRRDAVLGRLPRMPLADLAKPPAQHGEPPPAVFPADDGGVLARRHVVAGTKVQRGAAEAD